MIEVVENKIPITVSFKADAFRNADGKGGVTNDYLLMVSTEAKGQILLSIDSVEDVDAIIDKLLEHRKVISETK